MGSLAASEALSTYQTNPAIGRVHQVESTSISIQYSQLESEVFKTLASSEPPLLPVRHREDRIELWVLAQQADGSIQQLGQIGEQ